MDAQEERGMRLDAAVVARGLAPSREQAKRRILAGEALVNGRAVCKAAFLVHPDDSLCLTGESPRFVGRGGCKLEKALQAGRYDLTGARAMDIGASTGGFTDCILQHGAAEVYAIDVGHGQLHPKLRADGRVHNLEGTDIRDTGNLDRVLARSSISFCSIDVSFVSLKKVFPYVLPFLTPDAAVVCLIKPQFEAGRQAIGKKGVVRAPEAHRGVLDDFCGYFHSAGFAVRGLEYSPIAGGEGNIEYLALLKRGKCDTIPSIDPSSVVAEAHRDLRGRDGFSDTAREKQAARQKDG